MSDLEKQLAETLVPVKLSVESRERITTLALMILNEAVDQFVSEKRRKQAEAKRMEIVFGTPVPGDGINFEQLSRLEPVQK